MLPLTFGPLALSTLDLLQPAPRDAMVKWVDEAMDQGAKSRCDTR
jgi:hypothetical protein